MRVATRVMHSRVSSAAIWILAWNAGLVGGAHAASPACTSAVAQPTENYSFIVGSADFFDSDGDLESGSTFAWLVNGAVHANGPAAELLRLAFDDSLEGSGGEEPLTYSGVTYDAGRWGSAQALQPGGSVTYACDGNLDLDEGTIEMWVAPRADGDDPVYSSRSHYLFQYAAPNGDYISIAQQASSGTATAAFAVCLSHHRRVPRSVRTRRRRLLAADRRARVIYQRTDPRFRS